MAQLDFVAITNKYIMIIETTNICGDIYVNESGDFIRNIKNRYGKVIKTEPVYSPIAKNDRNIRIVKDILIKNKIVCKCPVISGVVIANTKCIIDKSEAPSKIKNEIFRYDQITEILNKNLNNNSDFSMGDNVIKRVAEFLIKNNKNITTKL